MVRSVTLATLAVIGALMTSALPSAQSFNVGRIIVTRPIILLSALRGSLEVTPPVRSTTSLAHASRFVERMLNPLAPAAPLKAGVIGVQPSSIAPTLLPQMAGTRVVELQSSSSVPVVVPVAGTADLPPPAALAAALATAPSAATTEQAAGQELEVPSQVPQATPAQGNPKPGLDPARSGHRGSGHSGSGDGGSGRGSSGSGGN